jgi:ParB-like chromosome segregation protein Spo0J
MLLKPSPVFPPSPPEEYEALKNDISRNGVRQPILVTSSGNIIDRNERFRAVTELGIRNYPIRVVGNLSEMERREMAIAVNLLRRHLTRTERQHWLEELIRLSPQKSSRELAATAKVSQSTAARAKAKVLGTESNELVEVVGHNGKAYTYKLKPAAQEEVQTAEDGTEKAADRKVTKTRHRVATPVVEVSLIAAELLGKAYSLLIEAEKLGITPDCIDILTKISVKTTAQLAIVRVSS